MGAMLANHHDPYIQRGYRPFVIKDFHEQYVLVPADKATNNIIVICKKYYLEIILSELSIVNPCTYINVNKDCSTLIAEHLHALTKWNISIPAEMKQLPTIYWLPKLHFW